MQSSGSIGLCLVWQTRPLCIASYAISVRQTGSLPVSALHCLHIRLPSDSTSRWTPLPSANSSYCQVCSGLSPPSYCPCRAHHDKARFHPQTEPGFCYIHHQYPSGSSTSRIVTLPGLLFLRISTWSLQIEVFPQPFSIPPLLRQETHSPFSAQ